MTDTKLLFDRTEYSDISEDLLIDAEKIISAIADTAHVSTGKAMELVLKKSIGTNTFYLLQTLVLFLGHKYKERAFTFLARVSLRKENLFKEMRKKSLRLAQMPDFTFRSSISNAEAEMGFLIKEILVANEKKNIPGDQDAFNMRDLAKKKKKEKEQKIESKRSLREIYVMERKCVTYLSKIKPDECMEILFSITKIVFEKTRKDLCLIEKYKSNNIRVRQGNDIVVPRRILCVLIRKAKSKKEMTLTDIAIFFTPSHNEPDHVNILHNIDTHGDVIMTSNRYREQYFNFLKVLHPILSKLVPLVRVLSFEKIDEGARSKKRKAIFMKIITETIQQESVKNLQT